MDDEASDSGIGEEHAVAAVVGAVAQLGQLLSQHTSRQNRILQLLEEDRHAAAQLLAHHLTCTEAAIGWMEEHILAEGDFYIRPRSLHHYRHWVTEVAIQDPAQWRETFRVSMTQFMAICNFVAPAMITNPPPGLRNIPSRFCPVGKQVQVALYRLAHGGSFGIVARHFGIAEATARKYCQKFFDAVIQHMGHFLVWPEDQSDVKAGFENMRGFPNCCGALDCSHVEVELPRNAFASDYFDRDKDHSIILQAVVDTKCRFLDVRIGDPGSCNDIDVLRKSELYRLAQGREILSGPEVTRENVKFREYILGDSGYYDLPWLVIPFPGAQAKGEKEKFNFLLSSSRIAVERSFGLLKGRWRLLRNRVEMENMQALSVVVQAGCILHNFIISTGDVGDIEILPEPERNIRRGRPPVAEPEATTLRSKLCSYVTSLKQK